MVIRSSALRDCLVVAAVVCTVLSVATVARTETPDASRQWKSNGGKYSTDAKLIGLRDNQAVLQRADGKQIEVAVDSLSDEDREFILQWRGRTADTQPAAQDDTAPAGPTYGNDSSMRVKLGVEISAPADGFRKLVATFPLPMQWPEQSVQIVDKEFSSHVGKVRINTLAGGVRQAEVHIPRLAAGETARAVYVLDVQRRWTYAPEHTDNFVVPRRVPREVRKFLKPSPLIETDHREIKEAARQFAIDKDKPVWPQVEAIYGWVREHIRHEEGTIPLRGALAALRQQTGDCEEYTSLFVALCRVNGIPARSVWIPGHTYPEFYLQDHKGHGHWFPCESLGDYSFGKLHRHNVVLQKGDNFKMSQKKDLQRYVSETLSGLPAGAGGGQPVLRPVREFIPTDAQ
jgi:transglutaminase-like putative cysteine protease